MHFSIYQNQGVLRFCHLLNSNAKPCILYVRVTFSFSFLLCTLDKWKLKIFFPRCFLDVPRTIQTWIINTGIYLCGFKYIGFVKSYEDLVIIPNGYLRYSGRVVPGIQPPGRYLQHSSRVVNDNPLPPSGYLRLSRLVVHALSFPVAISDNQTSARPMLTRKSQLPRSIRDFRSCSTRARNRIFKFRRIRMQRNGDKDCNWKWTFIWVSEIPLTRFVAQNDEKIRSGYSILEKYCLC